jgi:hypothetical protein
MGFDAVSINYSAGYAKITTDYDTKTNREPAPNYRIRQRINFGYDFTDKFNFKTRFQFDSVYSNANVVRNSFLHFQVFEYNLTDHISANIGHSNGNNAFNIVESPQDYKLENNVKFYDPKISEYSIGIGLSI